MELDVVVMAIVLGLAVMAMAYVRPVKVVAPDLSAVFIYWPEAYRLAERGDAEALEALVPGLSCAGILSRTYVDGSPGVAYRVLNLTCRWRS